MALPHAPLTVGACKLEIGTDLLVFSSQGQEAAAVPCTASDATAVLGFGDSLCGTGGAHEQQAAQGGGYRQCVCAPAPADPLHSVALSCAHASVKSVSTQGEIDEAVCAWANMDVECIDASGLSDAAEQGPDTLSTGAGDIWPRYVSRWSWCDADHGCLVFKKRYHSRQDEVKA